MNRLNRYFLWKPIYDKLIFLNIILLYACILGEPYIHNNYFVLFSKAFYLVSIPMLLYFALTIAISLKPQNAYIKGGMLYDWYDYVLSCKGASWLNGIFEQLQEKGLIKYSEKLVFISPSANKGIYEKSLFKYVSQKHIPNKFIVTDLSLIDNHEENETNSSGEYIYLYEQNNAKDIQNTLQKAGEQKANIIFDSIGCLWYIKELIPHKKLQCMSEMIEVLAIYSNALDKDGLIIIDNEPKNIFETLIREFNCFNKHLKFGAGPYSTGQYFEKLSKKYPHFRNYINDNFDKYTFDTKGKRGRNVYVMVLKKK